MQVKLVIIFVVRKLRPEAELHTGLNRGRDAPLTGRVIAGRGRRGRRD